LSFGAVIEKENVLALGPLLKEKLEGLLGTGPGVALAEETEALEVRPPLVAVELKV
jgi:hypothetical protein